MKIIVLDIAASKTGALSILRDFARFLTENPDENEWIFVTGGKDAIPDSYTASHPAIKVIERSDVKASWGSRLIFEHLSGAGFLRELQPDIVFSLENTLPQGDLRLPGGRKMRQVLYVHQPLGFQSQKNFSFLKRDERHLAIYQHLISKEIEASCRRADRVIVQTAWMREAVARKCRIGLDKISIVTPDISLPANVDDANPPSAGLLKTTNKTDVSNASFFYPAGAIYYKNHELVCRSARLLLERGVDNFNIYFTLNKKDLPWIADLIPNQIHFIGPISREEVFKRYRDSILLFPSYIETFGFPLAEARAVGAPILAADTPFARELLASYGNAEFFDFQDERSLADLMEAYIRGRKKPIRTAASPSPPPSRSSYAELREVILH